MPPLSRLLAVSLLALPAFLQIGCGERDAAPPTEPPGSTPAPAPPPERPPLPQPAEVTMALRSLQLHGDGPDDMAKLLGEESGLPAELAAAIAGRRWVEAADALRADELARRLAGSVLYWSLRSDVLARAGREAEAREAIERAVPLAGERSHTIYHTWRRARALGLQPAEPDADPVLGVAMEVGYPEGLMFLVAWADGGASLYLGGGGGVLGGQAHAPVRAAAARVNHVTSGLVFELADTSTHPLPRVGEVRLTALSRSGARAAVVPSKALESGRHALSPVFMAMHRLITRLREYSERRPPR